MAGSYIKTESVIAYNDALYKEIISVTQNHFATMEIMSIMIKKMIYSFSSRNCDVNKKRFFEECLKLI